ncbi:MAG TPA: choice-of-anchor tandem repeat GloVer-containing protein, partial [Candidatus Synoicihabitans sp.]|nr:choice-of-anchor tandem repeat GloVer-containing protein [Candidatus Synoicihabitans sp.]
AWSLRARIWSCFRLIGAGVLLASLMASPSAQAQATTIHTFTDGGYSTANLVQTADGTLYTVTRARGGSNDGRVIKLQPDGSGYQVVHTFSGSAREPDHSFILGRDGALYGTGEFGGTANFGMLYKLNPDGTGFSLLRSFTAGGPNVVQDGGAPRGGLVHASDGFLYGVTTTGTAASTNLNDRNGVIYRIAPNGSDYRIIFSFDGGAARANGTAPNSIIVGRDGNLYGTALGGPAAAGGTGGVVFTLRTDGTGFTVLKTFGNTSTPTVMHNPQSPLVHAADGYLYGTVRSGGATGDGLIFRLRTDGSGFEVLHTFRDTNSANGLEPSGAFFQGSDGALYGRTNFGGTIGNNGVIYKIRTDGTGFRVLASLPAVRALNFPGLIQGSDGALYATTDSSIVRVDAPPGVQITAQPRSQTIATGGSVTFSVTAPTATSYQWRRDGTNISGATGSTYTIDNLTSAANGTYTVVVGNADDSVTSEGAVLLVATPDPGRLVNLSVRTTAGKGGAETLIVGFFIGGTGSKQVLVRGVGPTLGTFGVAGTLADPEVRLHAGATPLVTNTGWGGSTALSNAFVQVGAFPLAATSRDAALLSTLTTGGYSAHVVSSSNATGVTLVEVYDADSPSSPSRLVNLSARTVAGTGAETLITGFVFNGNVPRTLLIRGIGPTLANFGVSGVLASPRIELHTTINNVDTTIATNTGWGGSSALSAAFTQVGAFPLPANSADAALLITLMPGAYSAHVIGVGNTTGVALVEVYEVP